MIVAASCFLFLAACGGHKPAGASPFPVHISLNPATSLSMQVGSVMVFTASAQNSANTSISPAFTFTSSSPGIVDISPAGFACAGNWNAPYYNVCTPGGLGAALVTASALGATSAPTLVFVHQPIDSIQVSVVPPVNSPPAACPSQVALPKLCDIQFAPTSACLSANQTETLQARAFSQGTDITASVGPFNWTQANFNVVKITPIITSTTVVGSQSYEVVTNQATVVSDTPGATQVVASASGVSSAPYIAETCPVQCIDLELGVNGSQSFGNTTFVADKGTTETVTATAVDVQGCIVPKPALTWTSSSPAALSPGSGTASCTGAICSISTAQPGSAAIAASCSPPGCNIGFPLNAPGVTGLYLPEPVYSVTAVSGLVTGATSSTTVFAASQDCYSSALCPAALYGVSTTTNLPSNPLSMPEPPNSLIFDSAGDKAYAGSQYGSFLITSANLGSSSTSPFTLLPAASTTLGLVTGKVLTVSPNGSLAIFSDTISTPNQVYVASTAAGSSNATSLNINGGTVAAFSPDNSKAFILGNGGNTLYAYSPLQALQTYPLNAPADAIAFSSTGALAFIAGGDPSANVTVRNTCDNSPAVAAPPATGSFSITGLPATPLFLKMIPPGSIPGSSVIPPLQETGLDVFYGIDNSGIDIFATTTATPLIQTSLCPQQQVALAQTLQNTTFAPLYISLQKGKFHPIDFFLSPDATQVYIVTTDLGVLVYNFATGSTGAIPLAGGAAPVAADITVDGTLLYVAGTDGLLHQLNTALAMDEMETSFPQLPNSTNNFCYLNYTCALNIVAVKP
jgi:hypothetical protein